MKTIALMDKFGNEFTEGIDFICYAEGFLERDCKVVQLDPYTIDFESLNVKAHTLKSENGFERDSKEQEVKLTDFDAIVDLSDIVNYEFAKQLSEVNVLHINPPVATFNSADKKTYIDHYPEFIPKTVVGSDIDKLLHALKQLVTPDEFGSLIVLKDPYGSCGKNIEKVDINEPNSKDFINKFTNYGTQDIVAQKYMHFATEGSKRVGIIGDINKPDSYKIIHFYKRVPTQGNWKDNLSQGGKVVELSDLRDDEKDLCLSVAKRSGLYTVGLDIMDDLDSAGNKVPRLVETNAVLAISANGFYNNKIKIITDYILDNLVK